MSSKKGYKNEGRRVMHEQIHAANFLQEERKKMVCTVQPCKGCKGCNGVTFGLQVDKKKPARSATASLLIKNDQFIGCNGVTFSQAVWLRLHAPPETDNHFPLPCQ